MGVIFQPPFTLIVISIAFIIFICYLITKEIIENRRQIKREELRKEHLEKVLYCVDTPTINIFNIPKVKVIEDPYSVRVITKFNDFALLSDFRLYDWPSLIDCKEGNVFLIPESLKKKLQDHKRYLSNGDRLFSMIKEEYMIAHTDKSGKYDIHNNHGDDPVGSAIIYTERIKDNYPLPSDWDKIRQEVIERDKHCCVLCCEKLDSSKLHIHHIKYRKQGGSHHPKNLVSLCIYCHASLPQHTLISNTVGEEIFYYVNVKSKIIHNEGCKYASGSDISQLSNYDLLIKEGYKPCSFCKRRRFRRSLWRGSSLKDHNPWDPRPQSKKIILNIYTQRPDLINKVLLSGNPLMDVMDERYFYITEKDVFSVFHLE